MFKLNSPTWLYIRQLSSNVDRFASFLELMVPKMKYTLWNIGYNYNKYRQKKREIKLSPEKLARNILIAVLIIYLGFIGVATLAMQTEKGRGVRFASLITSSMSPEIKPGSMIVSQKMNSYTEGDIISYLEVNPTSGTPLKSTITHRIISIKKLSDGEFYITKGDNIDIPDPVDVKKELVLGKVVKVIPHLGWVVSYITTPPGFGMFIILPTLVILLNEAYHVREQMKEKRGNLLKFKSPLVQN